MSYIWVDQPDLLLRLVELWNSGLSASQCAFALGNGLTRNACVAKIDRLRKAGAVELRAVEKYIRKAPVVKAPRLPKPKPAPVPTEPDELLPLDLDGEPITAMNAKSCHCRYVYGEPAFGDYRFCGRQVSRGSFCEGHWGPCHQPLHAARRNEDAA